MFEIRKREKQCLLKSEERQTEAFSFCPEETFFFFKNKSRDKATGAQVQPHIETGEKVSRAHYKGYIQGCCFTKGPIFVKLFLQSTC